MIFELLRVERGGLLVDELYRKIDHFLLGLRGRNFIEEVFGLAKLVCVAKHRHAKAVLKRSYADQPLAPANGDLCQTDLASFAKGITNDDVSFARECIRWGYKIRTFKV